MKVKGFGFHSLAGYWEHLDETAPLPELLSNNDAEERCRFHLVFQTSA